ncbi:MAG: hypothetical protein IJC16_02575 [Rikenellaceae bacterium]|nr:hypothetical protein [Rikenellaceae bacterium]
MYLKRFIVSIGLLAIAGGAGARTKPADRKLTRELVGEWVLVDMNSGDRQSPLDQMFGQMFSLLNASGQEISLAFTRGGTLIMRNPQEQKGTYEIRDSVLCTALPDNKSGVARTGTDEGLIRPAIRSVSSDTLAISIDLTSYLADVKQQLMAMSRQLEGTDGAVDMEQTESEEEKAIMELIRKRAAEAEPGSWDSYVEPGSEPKPGSVTPASIFDQFPPTIHVRLIRKPAPNP